MEWSPHPLHTYAWCLTSLICCGWEHWTSIMLLPQKQNIFIRVFEFGWNCGWLPCAKSSNDAMIETPDLHGMVPTSSSYICEVFNIIHMLWMQGLDLNHAVTTNIVVPSFWIWMKSCVTALHQMKSWCIDSGSRLTWNGHHFLFIHMQGVWHHSYAVWIRRLDLHHAFNTELVFPSFWIWLKSVIVPCIKWIDYTVIEAPDPHGMVPTSSSYIHKVFVIIQKLWMGGLNLHYAVTTELVVPSFWIWQKYWVKALRQMESWCNDWG
jgi:hypothetical protein